MTAPKACFSLPRNGTSRTRTGNAVGTSYETTDAACMRLCGVSRLSLRSAYHRRNLPSIQGKRASEKNQETVQTPCASIPIRCPQCRALRTRWPLLDTLPRASDPSARNRNCRTARWVPHHPTDTCVLLALPTCHRPRDGTVPLLPVCLLALWRK